MFRYTQEEQPDPAIKHSEGITKRVGDFIWSALDCCRVGHTPVRRHRLPRPQRTDLIRCVIADGEDEIQRGGTRLRELIPGLAAEVLSAQTRVLDLTGSKRS